MPKQKVTLKEINKIALPAILAGIAEPLIGIVDTAFIGNLPENATESLGGVGIAASLFSFLIWMLAQTKTSISSIVSGHYGKGSLKNIQPLIPQALLIIFCVGTLFFGLTYVFSEEIFELYNAQGELLSIASEYYSIRVFGLPLALVTYGIFGIFRGLQNTIWAMKISLLGVVVNIASDAALIHGIDGLVAPLGVRGVAYASLFSQILMLGLSVYFLLKKTPFGLKFQMPFHKETSKMLVLTGNLLIRTAAMNFCYFLANRLATGYGDEYIAAHSIVMNIWLFSSFFIDGYANAGNAIGGKLRGREDFFQLYQLGTDLAKISALVGVLLSLCYAGGYFFIGYFFSHDPKVISLFQGVFWILVVSQPINAITFSYDGIFKGMGEGAILRNVLLVSSALIFCPVILLLDVWSFELYGIWIAFLVWMIARGAPLWYIFRKRYLVRSL